MIEDIADWRLSHRLVGGYDRFSTPTIWRPICLDEYGRLHTLQQRGTIKFAPIIASAGDTTIVEAVAGKKIRVHQCALQIASSANVRFESGAGGTALTGIMPVVAGAVTAVLSGSNGTFLLPYSPLGWFETAINALLNLELSASTAAGVLAYAETD